MAQRLAFALEDVAEQPEASRQRLQERTQAKMAISAFSDALLRLPRPGLSCWLAPRHHLRALPRVVPAVVCSRRRSTQNSTCSQSGRSKTGSETGH
ncbi:hypothetical protein [Streptomyces sp. NPDC020917]|uniref:hypothetical protein n=1 Tax=Streptomyces sp. NPDC020917 TaxID=3365102 RepID=UPI0037B4F6F3